MAQEPEKKVYTWVQFYRWCKRVRRDIINLETAVKKLDPSFKPGPPAPGDPGDPPRGPFA